MRSVRETGRWIALAAFVPLLVFAALQIAGSLQQQRRSIEADTLRRAEAVNGLVDRALMADLGALSVLSTSPLFINVELEEARGRAIAVMQRRPRWRNVVLTTPDGRELWDASTPEANRPARASVARYIARTEGAVGGIERACLCVSLHMPVMRDGVAIYVITVERDTDDIQRALLAHHEGAEVAAVVDSDGEFIARTLAYRERIGTPATNFVREAIARGDTGVYSGQTYEGLRNRTAFATSPLNGWSTHIAVPSRQMGMLDAGWAGATALAGLVALVFAGGFSFFGLREARRRRQEELGRVQRNKLEALGQMAGEVAHDFNNLLTPIIGNLKRLDGKIADPSDARAVSHALLAAERGAELTKQLLAFARDKDLDVSCIDLKEIIERMRPLLTQSMGPNIDLVVEIAENARHVLTNGPQAEVALLNMALNARDAMPNGGRFEIRSFVSSKAEHVDIVVRDNGEGMDTDVMARAIEPFFTTKDDKGTGLGLAQVHSLAVASDGALSIRSETGKGTDITLRLKACAPAAA